MKRTITLLIATALIFGMSQCKKNVETITPSNLGETVHITVNIGGDKHEVFPNTGAVVFTNGDIIYVGDGYKYLGALTYASGTFSGEITKPTSGRYLYFFFLGGLTLESPETYTTRYTLSIADQSSHLPVLSFGKSTEAYTHEYKTYSCTLENQCGLVKFNLSTATDKAVTVDGLYTKAIIDFACAAQPAIQHEGTEGAITLRNEGNNSERWAILLPQYNITNPTATIAGFSTSIDMETVPHVYANTYHNTGVNITMTANGILPGDFTVASGTTVKFSQGNLQYIGSASTPYWKFAEHQYEYLGNNGQGSASTTADRDLFGWGTSGYNNGQSCYQPYSINGDENYYGPEGDLTVNGKSDWGYNAISNGGNTQNSGWRTLTSSEWTYLFDTRSNTTVNGTENARFTKATITTSGNTTVNGVIIFPDSYAGGTPSGVTWGTINGTSNGYTTTCTADGWNALEVAGCVFLPAAGWRGYTNINAAGSEGFYWSSTYNMNYNAYFMEFSSSNFKPETSERFFRGQSVRLVR